MNCKNCGNVLNDNAEVCENCGTAVSPFEETKPVEPVVAETPVATPAAVEKKPIDKNEIPAQYKPLSPWAYLGYSLLYSVPVVGFICLIIFSLSDDNINRRNYARSYWCALLVGLGLAVVIGIITIAIVLIFGASSRDFAEVVYQY